MGISPLSPLHMEKMETDFSEMHSSRASTNNLKLQQNKIPCLTQAIVLHNERGKPWARSPERLWHLHPWRRPNSTAALNDLF